MAENVNIVKQIKKRKNTQGDNQFSSEGVYPFGVQGIYTDMFSGLNLEEQFRIGGTKETEISYQNNYTLITNKFYLNSDKDSSFYYKLETKIHNLVNTFFIGYLQEENKFLISDNTDNNLNSFIANQSERKNLKDLVIEITLYTEKKIDNVVTETTEIQKKYISFNTDENGKITNILEELWKQPIE